MLWRWYFVKTLKIIIKTNARQSKQQYLLKSSSISLKGVFQTHEQEIPAARDNLQGGHILSILHMQCLRKNLWTECMLTGSVCTH